MLLSTPVSCISSATAQPGYQISFAKKHRNRGLEEQNHFAVQHPREDLISTRLGAGRASSRRRVGPRAHLSPRTASAAHGAAACSRGGSPVSPPRRGTFNTSLHRPLLRAPLRAPCGGPGAAAPPHRARECPGAPGTDGGSSPSGNFALRARAQAPSRADTGTESYPGRHRPQRCPAGARKWRRGPRGALRASPPAEPPPLSANKGPSGPRRARTPGVGGR